MMLMTLLLLVKGATVRGQRDKLMDMSNSLAACVLRNNAITWRQMDPDSLEIIQWMFYFLVFWFFWELRFSLSAWWSRSNTKPQPWSRHECTVKIRSGRFDGWIVFGSSETCYVPETTPKRSSLLHDTPSTGSKI